MNEWTALSSSYDPSFFPLVIVLQISFFGNTIFLLWVCALTCFQGHSDQYKGQDRPRTSSEKCGVFVGKTICTGLESDSVRSELSTKKANRIPMTLFKSACLVRLKMICPVMPKNKLFFFFSCFFFLFAQVVLSLLLSLAIIFTVVLCVYIYIYIYIIWPGKLSCQLKCFCITNKLNLY